MDMCVFLVITTSGSVKLFAVKCFYSQSERRLKGLLAMKNYFRNSWFFRSKAILIFFYIFFWLEHYLATIKVCLTCRTQTVVIFREQHSEQFWKNSENFPVIFKIGLNIVLWKSLTVCGQNVRILFLVVAKHMYIICLLIFCRID